MWDQLAQQAPSGFGHEFLEWVCHLESVLSVRFGYWSPADAGEVRQYAASIGQQVPQEVSIYYEHADPVSYLVNGWHRWRERDKQYRRTWARALTEVASLRSGEARRLVNDSPPLWPLDCFEGRLDYVSFVGQNGELVVLSLSLSDRGRGKPVAIGLRNYFLSGIALEALAEDMNVMSLDEIMQHPVVLEVSGWPQEPPFPQHVALTIDALLG
jgi:hypothetical protein